MHGWTEKCQLNRRLPFAWIVSLMVMISGCAATVATIAMMIYSHWKRRAIVYAKWTGLAVGELYYFIPILRGFSPQKKLGECARMFQVRNLLQFQSSCPLWPPSYFPLGSRCQISEEPPISCRIHTRYVNRIGVWRCWGTRSGG